MAETETNRPIDAEPFSEHTVNMLVSPELLREVLRLPAGTFIEGVGIERNEPFSSTFCLRVHILAPDRAVMMEPSYYTSTGWPDPIHLHDIQWFDANGQRIGDEASPAPQWLIWSHEHSAWWRPNRLGYTGDVAQAGRYTKEDAQQICDKAAFGWRSGLPPEVMVRANSKNVVEAVAQATSDAVRKRQSDQTPLTGP